MTEGVWDSRYRYVDEFRRMGAQIQVDDKTAVVEGVEYLTGAPIHASDLRAGAALVIAGLAAKGRSEITQVHYIERGYEDIVSKLQALGADIQSWKNPTTSIWRPMSADSSSLKSHNQRPRWRLTTFVALAAPFDLCLLRAIKLLDPLHTLASGSSAGMRPGHLLRGNAPFGGRGHLLPPDHSGPDRLWGVAPRDLTAILITHEHSDHVSGLRVLSKRAAAPSVPPAPSAAAWVTGLLAADRFLP